RFTVQGSGFRVQGLGFRAVRSAARRSSPSSDDASSLHLLSIVASAVSGTSMGAPIAIAATLNGFGTCVRSQLPAVQKRDDSMWNGRSGLPVAPASHTAPGCATRAGPLGPSIVNAAHLPEARSRFNCTSARTPPRDDDPRDVA